MSRNCLFVCFLFLSLWNVFEFKEVYWPTDECFQHEAFVSEFNELCQMVHERKYQSVIESLLTELHLPLHNLFHDIVLRLKFQQVFGTQWRNEHYQTHGCYKVERPDMTGPVFPGIMEYPECHKELIDFYKETIPASELKWYSAYIHHKISFQEYSAKHHKYHSPKPAFPLNLTTTNTTVSSTNSMQTTTPSNAATTTKEENTSVKGTTTAKETTAPIIEEESETITTSPRISCSVCTGTNCSDPQTAVQCGVGEFCVTEVRDHSSGKREIEKSCASKEFCYREWWHKTIMMPACFYVDNGGTATDIHCTFCCSGDSCNSGDKIISTELLQFDTNGNVAQE